MRISDERYVRDLRRLNLAMRLIQFEARTRTIRECTGLGDDRIRRLCHSYLPRRAGGCGRHRGCSPRAVLRIVMSPRLSIDAAIFVAISKCFGACAGTIPPLGSYLTLSLGDAERLCDAFDLYREIAPNGPLSFEQAVCVVRALWARDEIAVGSCKGCGAFILVDQLSLFEPRCSWCLSAPGSNSGRSVVAPYISRQAEGRCDSAQ